MNEEITNELPPVSPAVTTADGVSIGNLIGLLNASAQDPENVHSDSEVESDTDSEDSSPESKTNDAEDVEYDENEEPIDSELKKLRKRAKSVGGTGPLRGVSLLRDSLGDNLSLESLVTDRADNDEADLGQVLSSGDVTEKLDDASGQINNMTAGERLDAIINEFGEWTDDTEEFIESIPGALYRGVLVKGLVALSTKRLFIFAYIPRLGENKLIRSGAITAHIPGFIKRKHRAWIELRSDTITWFKSSTKLYKPVGASRLSQIYDFKDIDPETPTVIKVEFMDGRIRVFEFDTAESAHAWHADLKSALFTYRSTADKLRLALPLKLITHLAHVHYLSMAEQVDVDFEFPANPTTCDPEKAELPVDLEAQTVSFGFLRSNISFLEKLRQQVDIERASPVKCFAEPILEIDAFASTYQESETKPEDLHTRAQGFVTKFALPDSPSDLIIFSNCELVRTFPTRGSLCIAKRFLCFWSKNTLSTDTKLKIPVADINDAVPSKSWKFRVYGLTIQIHGSHDVRLDFCSAEVRDDVIERVKRAVIVAKAEALQISRSPDIGSQSSKTVVGPGSSSSSSIRGISTASSVIDKSSYGISRVNSAASARTTSTSSNIKTMLSPKATGTESPGTTCLISEESPIQTTRALNSFGWRVKGLHFVCLTIGSRGDVQPYIALGQRLIQDGNKVTIASHPEYREWVESYGIGYKEAGGDPAALMKLSVEHKMFSPGFFRESLGGFRDWLDQLFKESWEACQGADVLIESPSTMAGIHVAEGLKIPYFRAFTMPWTSTSTYPQAFAASVDLGPTYNQLSYTLFETILWKATAGQVNRWRKHTMKIPATTLSHLRLSKVPFIYNFSSAVVPKPLDWKDHIFLSGYWFVEQTKKEWNPPAGLLEFIDKARADGKPVIYIGFGSIVVSDAHTMTKTIIQAVKNADIRAVLAKGWSDRGVSTNTEPIDIPDSIFSVTSIEHERLFPLIDAACHHGGAGTTGASLRFGLPTLIHPFFGDQFFWASRVQKLGVGIAVRSLSEKDLTAAFKHGTCDRVMKEKAADVGEKIRAEDGPRAALEFIYSHIDLARKRADDRAVKVRAKNAKRIKEANKVKELAKVAEASVEEPALSPSFSNRSDAAATKLTKSSPSPKGANTPPTKTVGHCSETLLSALRNPVRTMSKGGPCKNSNRNTSLNEKA